MANAMRWTRRPVYGDGSAVKQRFLSPAVIWSVFPKHSETEFLLSAISVMEPEYGWHRANTSEAAAKIDADTKKVGSVERLSADGSSFRE